ncbi:MAG TPA: tetratricopeptide repeat protein [Gemmatimonadales bacterium]|nr:tetratricopeptide repeat protein [Gemmatimonadales bacterium]
MKLPVLMIWSLVATLPAAAQRIRLPSSLADLEKTARTDSNDAAAHYNVALAYWNAKRWDDADSALQRAIRIDPGFAQAYLARSRLVYARRPQLYEDIFDQKVPDEWRPQLAASYRDYQHAFLVDPLVDLRIEAAARPGRSVWWSASAHAEALYNYLFQGLDDVEAGKYEAAYNHLTRLYEETHPASLRDGLPNWVFYYKGLAAAHIGRFDEAIGDFLRLLERSESQTNPDSLTYYIPIESNQYRYIIGVLQQRAGRFNVAITTLRSAIEKDIGMYAAHMRLAEIYERHGMMPQAINERRQAANANADDPSLLLDLAKTLAQAGNWSEAEPLLQQAMAANPRDARVPYLLGIAEQRLNKPVEAKRAFTRFLTIAPSRYSTQISDARQRLSTLP